MCCSIRKILDGGRSGVIVGVFLILGCLPSARICPPYSKCWTRSYLISRRWVLLPEEDHTGKEMTQSWDFSNVFFLFISRTVKDIEIESDMTGVGSVIGWPPWFIISIVTPWLIFLSHRLYSGRRKEHLLYLVNSLLHR